MATAPQREMILNLLAAAEFATDRVSRMHTRIPHCTDDDVGTAIPHWIDWLSRQEASAVIAWLQEEVS